MSYYRSCSDGSFFLTSIVKKNYIELRVRFLFANFCLGHNRYFVVEFAPIRWCHAFDIYMYMCVKKMYIYIYMKQTYRITGKLPKLFSVISKSSE